MNINFLLFFVITCSGFAQQNYSFNYLIEYKFESRSDSIPAKMIYYMTNSEDNSYFAKLESLDSINFDLEFTDQDKIKIKVQVAKDNFFKAESMNIDSNNIWKHENDFKFRIKDYAFEILPDTLFEHTHLKNYKLKYIGKRKRKKSFPVGTNVYIIKDSTEFHLPLLTHSTAYEEWKKERNIPGGIFKEKIFYDYNNELSYKYILKAYYPINKRLILPDTP